MKKITLFLLVVVAVNNTYAQQKIKDGTVTGSAVLPNANAILDLESNSKGVLLPRVALTSTAAAAPLSSHVQGMSVYNTATAGSGTTAVTPGFYINDGTKWISLKDQDYDWRKTGNTSPGNPADTIANIYHIGGNVGIGTNNPKSYLHITEPGQASGIVTSYVDGITLTAAGVGAAIGYAGPGLYFENLTNLSGHKVFKLNYSSNANNEGILNFQTVSDDAGTSLTNPFSITHNGKIGINNPIPASILDVNGSAAFPIIVATTPAAANLDSTMYSVVLSGAGSIITLPAAGTCTGRVYNIVNRSGSAMTTSNINNFNGTTNSIPANSAMTVQSNGTAWYRIQ